MSKQRSSGQRSSGHYLRPSRIQAIGIGLIVAASIFWAVTERQSSLIIGAGLTMVLLGGTDGPHRELMRYVRSGSDEEEPPP